MRTPFLLLFALGAAGCVSLGDLPEAPPPLADMEEPLRLFAEPDDEALRQELAKGAFTGVRLAAANAQLDALFGGGAAGLEVEAVVENSPAAAAGLRAGDLLLSARRASGEEVELSGKSVWRKLELECPPGEAVEVEYDRAGEVRRCTVVPTARVQAPPRAKAVRLREELRAGFVVRTATEVEARAAGLGPGGGAVITGLARRSPWRNAGLRFGDLIAAIDGRPLVDPQLLLQHLRETQRDSVRLSVFREGEFTEIDAPLATRAQELQKLSLWPLFSHAARGERSETSVLLGLFGYEGSSGGFRVRLLWLFSFGGGSADRLDVEEADK